MADKNYELIYKMREFNTNNLQNIQVNLRNKADKEAAEIHKKYANALTRELGHSDFIVDTTSCIAKGIANHVYVRKDASIGSFASTPKGVGKLVCIYCGCDDFDF